MLHLLAQAPIPTSPDTPTGTWAVLITMILGAIGFRWDAYFKNKREAEDRDKELQLNTEIRNALRQVEVVTSVQNQKLESAAELNKAHHTELIRVLLTNCKANPVLVQQQNKVDKET
jgi:dsDNA-binding SOS-regulon protein